MSVFSGRLARGMEDAVFTPVDRTGPMGTVKGTAVNVRVLIDEGGAEKWQSVAAEHASKVLIYVPPTPPFSRDCVGGILTAAATGRTFRIEGFDVGKNQRNGVIEHYELTVSEQ